MNLSDYVRIIFRRGWIIILAAVLTAGAAFAFSKQLTPIFRATQKILIAPARNDNGLTLTLKQLMTSWVARLEAEARASEVIENLNLDYAPGYLASVVTVSPDLNALLINIDVDLPDGPTAAKVANTYGLLFKQWRDERNAPLRLEDRIDAELIDYPNYGLFRPNTAINSLAGGLLGFIWGAAVVFVLEFLSANIVRRPEDIERYLALPVLGALPEMD